MSHITTLQQLPEKQQTLQGDIPVPPESPELHFSSAISLAAAAPDSMIFSTDPYNRSKQALDYYHLYTVLQSSVVRAKPQNNQAQPRLTASSSVTPPESSRRRPSSRYRSSILASCTHKTNVRKRIYLKQLQATHILISRHRSTHKSPVLRHNASKSCIYEYFKHPPQLHLLLGNCYCATANGWHSLRPAAVHYTYSGYPGQKTLC